MNIWHKYPFVRLLIPLISGITTAMITGMPVKVSAACFIIVITLFTGYLTFISKRIKYKYSWFNGLIINLIIFFTGYYFTYSHTGTFQPGNVKNLTGKSGEFIITVSEPVQEKPNSIKVIATVESYRDSLNWHRSNGKVILYFEKDSTSENPHYGDVFIIRNKLSLIPHPDNPGEFDYAKYLAGKGIYCRGYLKKDDYLLLEKNNGNPVKAFGLSQREKFLSILKRNNVTGKEFAVASAILLGYDEYLDSGQRNAYASAGAMHILCVSGLHVGIIYIVLNTILGFLNRKRITKIIKIIFIIFFIWFYALITGFSPSVSRAATMFTFIIIGTSRKLKPEIYNILAASAFVLLLINPYILTDVGFQLSYLAVAGIAWIYKPVYLLLMPGSNISLFIWRITAVSLAAVFSTFPLAMFYFHKFPLLFLLTNLIVVPFAALIIYSGFLTVITSIVPAISAITGFLLSFQLKILNGTVNFIERLPFSTIENIYISPVQLFFIFGITFSFGVLFVERKKSALTALLLFFLLLNITTIFRKYENLKRNEIIVYNIKNRSAIQFTHGESAVIFCDPVLLTEKKKLSYHISGNLIQCGIAGKEKIIDINSDFDNGFIFKKNNFIEFGGKKIFISGKKIEPGKPDLKPVVDLLLIRGNPNVTIKEITGFLECSKIIIDGSNSLSTIKSRVKECSETGIKCFTVTSSGAYIEKI